MVAAGAAATAIIPYYWDDLADTNEADTPGAAIIDSVTALSSDDVPLLLGAAAPAEAAGATAALLVGRQHIAKFRRSSSSGGSGGGSGDSGGGGGDGAVGGSGAAAGSDEPRGDWVGVAMMVVRLPSVGTDVMVTCNVQLAADVALAGVPVATDCARWGGRMSEMASLARTLTVADWGLFGGGDGADGADGAGGFGAASGGK